MSQDHDQRFKTLIQMFFHDFLDLFFKEWADVLDTGAVEWLDKEIFHDPPEGQRRVLDLVGKLPTRKAMPGQRPGEKEELLALVHIEIESPDSVTPLRPRMYDAYNHLRRHYSLPVLPIALYLRVGLNGIGTDSYEEHFLKLQTVHFQFLYVGLPALDAVRYFEGENWLGVALAALMKIPPTRATILGLEALRRLQKAPLTDQQRFLVGDCVQAYLPLDEKQKQEFDLLTTSEPYLGVQAMNVSWFDRGLEKGLVQGEERGIEKGLIQGEERGIEKGLVQGEERGIKKGLVQGEEKGIEKGKRQVLRELLDAAFGPLSPSVLEQIEHLPADRLRSMPVELLKAHSLADLGFKS